MRVIDADALRQVLEVFTEKDTLGHTPLQLCDAMTAASPWHRVEDGLPKYGQDVLAARLYGADVDGWAYEIIIAHTCGAGDSVYWNATNVTHWMPIEPPKEEE